MIYTVMAYSDEDTPENITKRWDEPDNVFCRACNAQYVRKYNTETEKDAILEHAYNLYNFLMRSIKDSEEKVRISSSGNESVIIIRSKSFFQVIRISAFRNIRQASGIYKNFTRGEIDEIAALQETIENKNNKEIENAEIYKLYMLCIYSPENKNKKRMINTTVSAECKTIANIKFANKIKKQLRDLNVITGNIKNIKSIFYGHDHPKSIMSFDEYIQGKSPFVESFKIQYIFVANNGDEIENCIIGEATEYDT